MIKLIISDLDGCIVASKKIHFDAFNKALATVDPKFVITNNEHTKQFEGLSTRNKLAILAKERGFPLERTEEINQLKQQFTIELYETEIQPNQTMIDTVKRLKQEGYLFYVASNSVRDTLELALKQIGIYDLVDKIYSNESVKKQKPHSQIYLRCMADACIEPNETVIIEDSPIGREAAVKSGAFVCDMDYVSDFTYDRIKGTIDNATADRPRFAAKSSLNILIPVGGAGRRFQEAGYTLPKPLIDVNGKPMIQRVVENLNIDAQFIFVAHREHYSEHHLDTMLKLIEPGCIVVQEDGPRQGAANGALFAKEYINNDKHLLIANSDQMVDWDASEFIYKMVNNACDGGILTFQSDGNEKWSYAKADENGIVSEVAEKKVISDKATVGIYYYGKGSDFVRYTEQMIAKNIRTKGEFYICPVFNEFIGDGKKVMIHDCKEMIGIGTPEDLQTYLARGKQ